MTSKTRTLQPSDNVRTLLLLTRLLTHAALGLSAYSRAACQLRTADQAGGALVVRLQFRATC
eukprot:363501-Chlamydomonas_euryale.AAC.8